MSKNLIPEICKMLGVEIGEKFKVKDEDALTYRFTDDELKVTYDGGVEISNISTNSAFVALVDGQDEVVKLSWKPKKGDEVYTFSFTAHEYNSRFCPHKGVWYVTKWNWAGYPWQIAALDRGWVFRTKQEAEAALPAVATEMGVEYELPTSDTEAVEPWKPKEGEFYYSFGIFAQTWGVSKICWLQHPFDFALLAKGWVYRTKEEAKAALPKVAAEMGVDYEL